MNILIKAYIKNNLGDDLFLKILTERYKDTFTIITPYKNKSLKNIPNLKIKNNPIIQKIDKLIDKLIFNYSLYEMNIKKKQDIIVYIGGSLFIEKNLQKQKKKLKNYKRNYKPYYILGSNIGPYKTDEYLQELKKHAFKDAKDISLRDRYSYNLIKDLKNTRLTTDIVFNLDTTKYEQEEEKKVIISIIDTTNRFNNKVKESYEQKILELINYFKEKGYKVVLMSFCKYEKDEQAINKICKKSKHKVEKHFYNGDIEKTLKEISSSKIIVGTRFHANILGLLFNKTIIPISYNRKTTDILKDINYKGKIINLPEIEKFNIKKLTSKDLTYKLNIEDQRKLAEETFKELDKVLNRK